MHKCSMPGLLLFPVTTSGKPWQSRRLAEKAPPLVPSLLPDGAAQAVLMSPTPASLRLNRSDRPAYLP